jgi:hypothetical protein
MAPKAASTSVNMWKYVSIFLMLTLLPWAVYLQFRESAGSLDVSAIAAKFNLRPDLQTENTASNGAQSETDMQKESALPTSKATIQVSPIVVTSVPKQPPKEKSEGPKITDSENKVKLDIGNESPKSADTSSKREKSSAGGTVASSELETQMKSDVVQSIVPKADQKSAGKKIVPESKKVGDSKKQSYGSEELSYRGSSFKRLKTIIPKPIKGDVPLNGSKPLWGVKHKGTDAIFALACKYPTQFYKRFVGTLRNAGFTEDVVLAVSPEPQMKPGVAKYLQETEVVAYSFDVDCAGPDNCKMKDEFLG